MGTQSRRQMEGYRQSTLAGDIILWHVRPPFAHGASCSDLNNSCTIKRRINTLPTPPFPRFRTPRPFFDNHLKSACSFELWRARGYPACAIVVLHLFRLSFPPRRHREEEAPEGQTNSILADVIGELLVLAASLEDYVCLFS